MIRNDGGHNAVPLCPAAWVPAAPCRAEIQYWHVDSGKTNKRSDCLFNSASAIFCKAVNRILQLRMFSARITAARRINDDMTGKTGEICSHYGHIVIRGPG